MRTALITTSINVPTVLKLYRKLDPSVKFFVAADHKTPLEAYSFCADIPDCEIYSPERQKDLGYECSELLGWNTDSRRNIALLKALKWGAELIISIDDDMGMTPAPVVANYSENLFGFAHAFYDNFDGLQLGSPNQWFDAGLLTNPIAAQRGLPAGEGMIGGYSFVTDVKIGAAQGIILGVPDTGAITAIERKPIVYGVTDVLRNGFVVHPQAYSVFNSQLTAFRRELAPAFAQFYNHQGRNTDIFASMLMRRVMAERNLYTYFGPPMGFHARQPRPLFKDLKAEMFGLEHIDAFTKYVTEKELPGIGYTAINDCRFLMANCPIFSDDFKEAAMAWYRDCEKVL